MAKFTVDVPLKMEWRGHTFVGVAGTTHRLADAFYDEFLDDFVIGKASTSMPGLTWISVNEMTAVGGEHPDLASHDTLGLATQVELDAHTAAADPHTAYALDADLSNHEAAGNPHPTYATDTDLTTHAAAPHGGSLPAGLIVMWGGAVTAIPAGWLLCDGLNGTPDLRSRFIKGAVAGSDPGATGGSATHTHAGHSAHAVTQPSAHSDHAALSHSAHSGATVGNHTDVVNHVHLQGVNTAATGGSAGATPDASTSGSTAAGVSTANPTSGGVAAQVHAVGQASAHTDHAAQSHSAHSGTAVDAHSVHDSPNSEPAYYALAFIQKS